MRVFELPFIGFLLLRARARAAKHAEMLDVKLCSLALLCKLANGMSTPLKCASNSSDQANSS